MLRALLPFLCVFSSGLAAPALDMAPVKKWLARQAEVRTVTAEFTQTRSLRALRNPIATPGRVWFSAPGSVRWEIGSPAKTVVVRKGAITFIVTPAKKRAERHAGSETGKSSGPLAMLRFPLARDYADFQRQFEVLAITSSAERCKVDVAPREPQARKFLTNLKIEFSPVNGHLLAFEMSIRDGSSMRQEFSNVRTNAKIPAEVFDYDLSGFEVTDAKE